MVLHCWTNFWSKYRLGLLARFQNRSLEHHHSQLMEWIILPNFSIVQRTYMYHTSEQKMSGPNELLEVMLFSILSWILHFQIAVSIFSLSPLLFPSPGGRVTVVVLYMCWVMCSTNGCQVSSTACVSVYCCVSVLLHHQTTSTGRGEYTGISEWVSEWVREDWHSYLKMQYPWEYREKHNF